MGASPTKEARHNLQDEAGSLNNLTSMAMKQIDIFRGQVRDTRGSGSALSKTEVTGGRTLRFKVIPHYTNTNHGRRRKAG